MTTKNKKKTAMIAGAAAVGAASFGMTFAYLTNGEGTINKLYVANNRITVTEEFPTPTPVTEGDNMIVKDVKIENTGNVPCFVRVFLDFDDDAVRASSLLSPDGTNFYSTADFRTHLPSGWIYGGDNYYYYQHPVEPGQLTPSLLKKVKTTFADNDDVKEFDIIVYAESIQTRRRDGSAITGSNAYRTAWTEYLSN